ncbi:MAG: hypothetical protein ACLP2Y_05550 [Limisphaerales bacterium]
METGFPAGTSGSNSPAPTAPDAAKVVVDAAGGIGTIRGLVKLFWVNMIGQIKDRAAGTFAGIFLNDLIKEWGTMTRLQVDSKNKTITCELDLKGEPAPLKINGLNYQLVEEEGETFFEITGIDTSREWITVVCDKYLKHRRIKLPPLAKFAL